MARTRIPYFVVRESPIQGLGAFAARRIRKGTRIIEYTGERISPKEADARYDDGAMERHHTFLFTVDRRTVIDAAVCGNDARFINHSCAPNCQAVIDDGRIFIEAIRNIQPGVELTYDYNYDLPWSQRGTYPCHCGAPECRGTIVKPKKKTRRNAKRAARSA